MSFLLCTDIRSRQTFGLCAQSLVIHVLELRNDCGTREWIGPSRESICSLIGVSMAAIERTSVQEYYQRSRDERLSCDEVVALSLRLILRSPCWYVCTHVFCSLQLL